ncbi:MAG: gliding motility-associated C-terminal domain-containing protein [Flavobacteriales bacterium]|nr:gliding motility-associated C-terminal domain-containing protein [Flavobacteriales bacterium]
MRQFLALLALWSGSIAQGQYWARTIGGLGSDRVIDVVTDAGGSIYACGEFSNVMTIGNLTVTSAGGTDAFVVKLNASGSPLWLVRGGGGQADRAVSLSVRNGAVAVTGHYAGQADLFGTVSQSQAGTEDLFIALLDASSGGAQWVRSAGSALSSDRSRSVDIGAAGEVMVTGSFKGDADFSGTIVSSTIDPLTLLPGNDVFIASYAGSGTLNWLKQAVSTADDEGVALVARPGGGAFVAGQYSGTIAFDLVHPGGLLNGSFWVALDGNGAEQAFRSFGGPSYNQVRDMALASSGELLLVGELQGTMSWSDPVPVNISATQANAVHVLRVAQSGTLSAHALLGSGDVVRVDAVREWNGTVSIIGEFRCHFTDMANTYGDGVFMSIGEEDLYVAGFALTTLNMTFAQQFGGRGPDHAGGLALLPGGERVFGGAMGEGLVIPANGTVWPGTDACNGADVPGTTYCSDPDYGSYNTITPIASGDGFLTRGVVPSRQPFDIWHRQGSAPCSRTRAPLCLWASPDAPPACSPDAITRCGDTWLNLLDNDQQIMAWSLSPGCMAGPELQFSWSDGAIGPSTLVSTTGPVSASVTTTDQCFSWSDQVDVTILPRPMAYMTDGAGQNVQALDGTGALTVQVCNDSVMMWYAGADPDLLVVWVDAVGDSLYSDSIIATLPGPYSLYVASANGCSDTTQVDVSFLAPQPLPPITGADLVLLDALGGPLDGDTLPGCGGSLTAYGQVQASWYINGVPATLPAGIITSYTTNGSVPYMDVSAGQPMEWFGSFTNGSGWYALSFSVHVHWPLCSDTVSFTITDSVYVALGMAPVMAGDPQVGLCPGGTAALPLVCSGCDSIQWTGAGIVGVSAAGDTAWVDAPGAYVVTAWSLANGYPCPSNYQFFVTNAVAPPLFSLPLDGIICPGDSALLYTTQTAADYAWTGPDGPVNVNDDSVRVSTLGEYFLTVTLPDGCVLSAGPIELTAFGAPSIQYQPAAAICEPGQQVSITVIADPQATITWQTPLSGNGPVQIVNAPGSYICQVLSCGTTYNLFASVSGPLVSAALVDPGPFAICPGDTVWLQAMQGQDAYLWIPQNIPGPVLPVSTSGAYACIAFDQFGCADTTAIAVVDVLAFTEPLVAQGAQACEGDDVLLTATGSGYLQWTMDTPNGPVLGTGGQLTVQAVEVGAQFWVVQEEGGCTSEPELVPITVWSVPEPPVLSIPDTVCAGTPVWVAAQVIGPGVLHWSIAGGSVVQEGALQVVATEQAMPVMAWLEANGCSSDTALVLVQGVACTLFVPNVFSPNGDGKNDTFVIEHSSGGFLILRIRDRWGLPVAELSGPSLAWDGRTMPGGLPVPEGVYFYVLDVAQADGTMQRRTGTVQLLR